MKDDQDPEMLEEYDFSGGVRGKYADEYAAGTNVVVLDPDLAERFRTTREVNEALRELIRLKKIVGGDG